MLFTVAYAGAFALAATPSNSGYDGSTSITINSATPTWLLLSGSGLHVSEIDIQVLGAQAGSPNDAHRWPREFGCWYAADPNDPYKNYTPIGLAHFLPEPEVNSTVVPYERTYPRSRYGAGLPAPPGQNSIVCGWDPKGQGYPDLVNGFGVAHLFYSESG